MHQILHYHKNNTTTRIHRFPQYLPFAASTYFIHNNRIVRLSDPICHLTLNGNPLIRLVSMAAIIYAIEITTQPGMLCMTTEKHRYMLRIPQMCVGSGTEATDNKNCSIYV